MRFFNQLLGFALILVGFYFLSQNIIFTTTFYRSWWQDLAVTGSILGTISGIIGLIFFPRQTGGWAWGAVAIGVILVFFSSRVLLKPTSLWYFFASFTALIAGLKLVTSGRLDF